MEEDQTSNQVQEFRTVVKALITNRGDILIGKKEEQEGHPISGEWHILGGHLEHGEQVEEAIEREIEEETGLEVETHQIVDVMSFPWKGDEKDSLQIVFHCQAERREEEPRDDLTELKWVSPDEITDHVHSEEAERLEKRKDQAKFLEKLEKMP
ncbi:MAG: NUDIX hydrolase, partial [Candidatus Nanosalina sp.]